jgi:AcrR family transcriptional regulator
MALRCRAVAAEDKEERRDAILDAAEHLLRGAPERVANVADVAARAGLAKGTVYLYFSNKEDLLLAVHERRVEDFFLDLFDLLERAPGVEFADIFAVVRSHLVDNPLFLPLAARCLGFMAQSLSPTASAAFKQRMAARLARGGAGIERHFPAVASEPGRGVATLRRGYSLVIGLWEVSAAVSDGRFGALPRAGTPPELVWSYPEELEAALRSLWHGMIAAPARPEGST